MAKETDLAESKGEIIAYLQTAQDIEKDIYMLETSCEELEKKAQKEDQFADDVLHSYYGYRDPDSGEHKDSVKKLQDEISNRQQRCEDLRGNIRHVNEIVRDKLLPTNLKTDYVPSEFDGGDFVTTFKILTAILAVLGIIMMILSYVTAQDGLFWVGEILLFGGWLIALIIAGIAYPMQKARDQSNAAASKNAENKATNQKNALENERIKKKYISEQNEIIRGIMQEIAGFEQQINKQKALADEHTANAQYYREQIENVKKDLEPLYRNRITFYSDGVVPVDYRTMDCVYVLEQIFRNDLADTMREAVLMYEERVFRGEIIRGMANIAARIDNLSSVMSRLRTDIDRISRDVAIMRDDVEQIYKDNREFADDIKKSNDKLYEETKLHRHALEALDNSNQALLGYAEKDRQSLEELAKSNQKLVDYIEDN